jgi:hypothetical protein
MTLRLKRLSALSRLSPAFNSTSANRLTSVFVVRMPLQRNSSDAEGSFKRVGSGSIRRRIASTRCSAIRSRNAFLVIRPFQGAIRLHFPHCREWVELNAWHPRI